MPMKRKGELDRTMRTIGKGPRLNFVTGLKVLLALQCIGGVHVVSGGALRGLDINEQQGFNASLGEIGANLQLQEEPAPAPATWTKEFVERLDFASYLGWVVKEEGISSEAASEKYNQVYQRFASFDDNRNDVSIVVKQKDVCYAIFQAQRRQNVWDVLQTLNPRIQQNAFGTNCDVRRSFYNGYETNYADAFRAEIDACVKSCGENTPCPFILSGNSVGGAIALTAALDPRLKQYNPITLTLGPLRTIINEDCTDLDTSSIYRIISANAGYYDAASDGSPKKGYHVGHTYIVDEMSHFAYVGYNNAKLRFPDSYNIHTLEVYLNRISNLLVSDVWPVDVSLYPKGHWCTEHDECGSGVCDSDRQVCVSGSDVMNEEVLLLGAGATCTSDSDCDSGKCFLSTCTLPSQLAGTGASCVVHADCESGRCTKSDGEELVCLPKNFDGNWCMEDADCESNVCGGPTSWVGKQKCLNGEAVVARSHTMEEIASIP